MNDCAVAVTGMGCLCAAGTTPAETWESLCRGGQNRVPGHTLHSEALPYPFFAMPTSVFTEGQRRNTVADILDLARLAADQALNQARIVPSMFADMAVVAGTTAGSALHFFEGYRALRSHQAYDGKDISAYFSSNLALNLAQAYGAHGATLTVANACTSGADAVGLAANLIAMGQCNVALCGGADVLNLVPHTGFARLMIYSPDACRPFDAKRQGLNLGEGVGMLVLENAAHAAERGAKTLGFIAGYGSAADAHHLTAPHPEARGLGQAVDKALRMAHIEAHDVAFINAHGTATLENDRVEGQFFSRHLPHVPVWGSKSITGHTLGAAGALEAIFCLMALAQNVVPPTWGFADMDPEIGLAPTQKLTPLNGGYALSTSLAFGGGNAALVLAREKP